VNWNSSQKDLNRWAHRAALDGQEMLDEGELTEEAAAMQGQAGFITQRLGDLQQGLGVIDEAYGAVAQIGALVSSC